MSKLENIGFYTLEDARAAQVSVDSPLWRCEIILTDVCNFKCPYCRGIAKEHARSLTWEEASFILDMWASQGLKNVRFSGGEPTLWKGYEQNPENPSEAPARRSLVDLVRRARDGGIERIAISTNGSVGQSLYADLVDAGANDFSVSLDACCAETGDRMAGDKKGAWARVTDNIRFLAKRTYVTVGVVFTESNVQEFKDIVRFASDDLGVSDIRILTSAQWNERLADVDIEERYLEKHPILRYRLQNFSSSRHVRGIQPTDSTKCPLMLDDMAVLNGLHYPCIIYLREQGLPVGRVDTSLTPLEAACRVREARLAWVQRVNTQEDPICRKNCLDVCIDYNNRATQLNEGLAKLLEKPPGQRRIIPIKRG